MSPHAKFFGVTAALAVGLYAAAASGNRLGPPNRPNPPNDIVWAKKIAEGGYILHFRHAQREKWNDVTAFDAIELLNNYAPDKVPFPRATCLTEQGRQEAALIRDVLAAAKIPVGRVVSSPSCRSRMTAEIAFGRIDEISNSLLHRTAIPKRQHAAFGDELRAVIAAMKPPKGTNDILSGHGGTLRFDNERVIDQNDTGENLDQRDETGLVVLENVDGKIIARYKFGSIHFLANAALELPVKRTAASASSAAKTN